MDFAARALDRPRPVPFALSGVPFVWHAIAVYETEEPSTLVGASGEHLVHTEVRARDVIARGQQLALSARCSATVRPRREVNARVWFSTSHPHVLRQTLWVEGAHPTHVACGWISSSRLPSGSPT